LKRPRPLPRGGTIGICAPAGPVKRERLERAIEQIESLGFRIRLAEHVFGNAGLFAADDDTRARELQEMFACDDVDAVFCARGGVGSSRLLERLEWRGIADSGKPFLGLSDITALQWALWEHARAVSFSGPLAVEWDGCLTPATREQCFQVLCGEGVANLLAGFPGRGKLLRAGASATVVAPLLVGNLTMIATLLGTPHLPDLTNAILLVEDINEPPHRVDRLFWHLRNAGLLNSLAALLIGDFGDGSAEIDTAQIERSVLDAASGAHYPILSDIPFGHGADRMTLPVGGTVKLDTQSMLFEWIDAAGGTGRA
jgi:muramoyltetrapeptide carboxypeptidase